jgi:hypothetical protein
MKTAGQQRENQLPGSFRPEGGTGGQRDLQERPDSERRSRTQCKWLTPRILRNELQIRPAGWTAEFRWASYHEGIGDKKIS